MFLCFINDIESCIPSTVKFSLFADDLKIYSEDSDSLQLCINNISNWSREFKLPLAVEKINCLRLGKSQNDYFIDSSLIKVVNLVRDLGIFVDSKLKFKQHVEIIRARTLCRISQVFKVFRCLDLNGYKTVYTTYIRPLLEYGTIIFSPKVNSNNSKRLEYPQRLFTKKAYSCCGSIRLSYPQRLAEFNLDSLIIRRLRSDLLVVFCLLSDRADCQTCKKELKLRTETNLRTSDRTSKLTLMNFKRYNDPHSFFSRAIALWNKVTDNFKEIQDIEAFGKALEEIDLSNVIVLPNFLLSTARVDINEN